MGLAGQTKFYKYQPLIGPVLGVHFRPQTACSDNHRAEKHGCLYPMDQIVRSMPAVDGVPKWRRRFGTPSTPVVIYIDRSYAVLAVEQLLAIVGYRAAKSLRPFATSRSPP